MNPNDHLPSETICVGQVFFQTLGCKVNQYESDGIRKRFEALGFRTVTDPSDCDVYVINTCTVTAEADRKSGQMIRRARRIAPRAIIAAMGCKIQMSADTECADVCVGTSDRLKLPDIVLERLKHTEKSTSVNNSSGPGFSRVYEELGPVISREATRAFVKIQDGCDNFCSYCIIPYARGRSRSRDPKEILCEIQLLGNAGYREIVLTGINLQAFGKEKGEDPDALIHLIEEINRIDTIGRIRIGSVEPGLIDERFANALAHTEKFCRHLHVSLQSGSDSVLSRMKRKYLAEDYEHSVEVLRKAMPEIALTTDIIVGFPAETDQEHRESLLFCKKIGFSKIHVFPYSIRKLTSAAEMKPKVDHRTAMKRKAEFLLLSDQMGECYAKRWEGKTVSVLIENKSGTDEYRGYSGEYLRVIISAESRRSPGDEASVFILRSKQGELIGREIRTRN